MESKSEDSAEDDETEGFNYDCGKTFIYPTNISLRDYQYKIVNEALFKNTMVCLPTGLGKTFIAAVVMYNFFRWYPNGKIIFMAPTKPLVKQQVDACYNIMAIPKASTAELTGNTVQATRDEIWEEKRVFFITPQVLQNDLERVAVLGKKIKCLVFDEAHRARGNHAYCEVIRKLLPVSRSFRVLALSATPGNTVNDVAKVCEGLLIAHFEMRTEDSADVTPFTHKKVLETVVVKLDAKLKEVYNDFITKVLDKYVRVLIKHHVVTGNCSSLTKGKLFYILEDYKEKHRQRGAASNEVLKNLNICLILYHAFEVLTKHGLRVFLNYLEGQCDKPLLKCDEEIKVIIEDLNNYLGPRPVLDVLPDGNLPEVTPDLKYGHPKYYKLESLLIDHYKNNDTKSKVIVFCEYRDSVMEVYTALLKHKSLIKPKIFLGQGVISQKQQNNVIEAFRSGKCNTLVSSCIGEEGLDVGEVDLVVCFDISSKSSIRLVQRMGRTGRKRDGKVIMLVTEGKEHQLLQDSLRHKDYMANTILHSKELLRTFYKNNPRMVPKNINPVCEKRYITVEKPKQKLANNNLKSMFNNMTQSTATILHFEDRIPMASFNFTKTSLSDILDSSLNNKLLVPIEQQRSLQSSYGEICSSKKSKVLFDLLQFSDSKRYKLPQVHGNSIRSRHKTEYVQGDIRNMFLQNNPQSSTNYKPSQIHSTVEEQLEKEIKEYLLTIKSSSRECNLCKYFFECNTYQYKEEKILNSWIPIDESLLSSITNESINEFLKSSSKTDFEPTNISLDDCDDIFANIIIDESEEQENSLSKEVEKNTELCETTIDSSFERESEKILEDEKMFNSPIMSPKEFEAPKSVDKIFQKYTMNEPEVETHNVIVDESASNLRALENLYHKTLVFFKLDSIEDLFKSPEKDWIDSDSPVLTPFEDRKKISQNESNPENNMICDVLTSPVLYSNRTPTKQSQYSSQKRRAVESPDLFDSDSSSSTHIINERQDNKKESINDFDRSSSAKLIQPQTKLCLDDICNTSFLHSITASQKSIQHQESINDFDRSSSTNSIKPQTKLSLDDICDTSFLHSITASQKSIQHQESINDFDPSSSANAIQPETKLSLDDICDTSFLHSIKASQKSIQDQEKLSLSDICDMSIMNMISETKKTSNNQKDLLIEDLCDNSILDMFKQNESVANFCNKSNNNQQRQSQSGSSKSLIGKVPSSASKPRKRLATKLSFDSTCNESISDDDFEDCTAEKRKTTKRTTRKKKGRDFLELEAEVSGSGTSDDDDDGSSQDVLEDSFVDDHSTQSNFNTTTMQALYIQTTRSPVLGGGKFKIPNLPKVVNQTILSQEESALDNTYLEDSFCVNSQVIDLTENDDLSELEEAEKLLAEKRKKKKSVSEDQRGAKRRRIIVLSDSD